MNVIIELMHVSAQKAHTEDLILFPQTHCFGHLSWFVLLIAKTNETFKFNMREVLRYKILQIVMYIYFRFSKLTRMKQTTNISNRNNAIDRMASGGS